VAALNRELEQLELEESREYRERVISSSGRRHRGYEEQPQPNNYSPAKFQMMSPRDIKVERVPQSSHHKHRVEFEQETPSQTLIGRGSHLAEHRSPAGDNRIHMSFPG